MSPKPALHDEFEMYHAPTQKLYHCNAYRPWDSPERFCIVFEDITESRRLEEERRQLREQLLQSQKMEAVGTLAGGIAHDFNNLLQITLGYSELLLEDKSKDHPDYSDLNKIFNAARIGSDLVKNLLVFSSKAEPHPVSLNLNDQILQVENLLRVTIPKMINVQLSLHDKLLRIFADRSQIEQVLMNIALNARDAMGAKGTLIIETNNIELNEKDCRTNLDAKPGKYVLLSVSDTGHGISEQVQRHIFEPFFTTKGIGKGTGLGLAIVYAIVKQHGGYIECNSEIGTGTTFNIYFPVPDTYQEDISLQEEISPYSGHETVLLVDDEVSVRDLGCRIFKRNGYTVITAETGEEALKIYEKMHKEISIAVLDLIMPVMGGKHCLQRMLEKNPNAIILIASGYSGEAAKKECLQLGASGFVSKPFRMKELLQEVRRSLDKNQQS